MSGYRLWTAALWRFFLLPIVLNVLNGLGCPFEHQHIGPNTIGNKIGIRMKDLVDLLIAGQELRYFRLQIIEKDDMWWKSTLRINGKMRSYPGGGIGEELVSLIQIVVLFVEIWLAGQKTHGDVLVDVTGQWTGEKGAYISLFNYIFLQIFGWKKLTYKMVSNDRASRKQS